MHIPFNFVNKLAKIFPFKRTYSSKAKKIFCIFLTKTIYIHVQHGLDQSYFGDSTVFLLATAITSVIMHAVLDKTSSSVIFNLGYKS